jgi:hypothetical protein
MSWLKGFEKVKNFAAENFAALSEEPDEDPENPVRELQVTKVKCEELTDLIATQEKEVKSTQYFGRHTNLCFFLFWFSFR